METILCSHHHRQVDPSRLVCSVKELIAKIDAIVTNCNKNCKPVIWTAAADSILSRRSHGCAGELTRQHTRGPWRRRRLQAVPAPSEPDGAGRGPDVPAPGRCHVIKLSRRIDQGANERNETITRGSKRRCLRTCGRDTARALSGTTAARRDIAPTRTLAHVRQLAPLRPRFGVHSGTHSDFLGKLGIEQLNSDLVTLVRTVVIFFVTAAIVFHAVRVAVANRHERAVAGFPRALTWKLTMSAALIIVGTRDRYFILDWVYALSFADQSSGLKGAI